MVNGLKERFSAIEKSVGKSVGDLTFKDVAIGVYYGFRYSGKYLIDSFVIIPTGILVLFTILYGLNNLLTDVIKIKFPCSVLGMLINLILLIIMSSLADMKFKDRNSLKGKVSRSSSFLLANYLRLIKPSMNFSLKWINVFFIPSFIILPLSDHITFVECVKIAAIFVVGFLFLFTFDVYMIACLRWIFEKSGILHEEELNIMEESGVEKEVIELESISSNQPVSIYSNMRDDITTIDLSRIRHSKSAPLDSTTINYMGKNSKDGVQSQFPLGIVTPSVSEPQQIYLRNGAAANQEDFMSIVTPSRTVTSSQFKEETSRELLNLSKSAQEVTLFVTKYIDWILYFLLFFISLPFYYVKKIHIFLPYHLALTVLSFYSALLIPLKWPKLKKIAHPILISTAEILFVCFIGSLIYHSGKADGFLQDLEFYKTGKNYKNLFNNEKMYNNGMILPDSYNDFTATPKWPGCGDFLGSLMEISIVALSLPMFTHRKDFVKNFWLLVPPLLSSTALTYLLYPLISHKIGISPTRSIGFIGRSVTLALGTPLITALEGSVSLMAVCTILSGIMGVMVGDHFFKFLRVKKDDYVTRGVSLGINCGAIATAHLLNHDPRAASMSSLSFSIFGTIMIIVSSIGTVREFIRSLVGL